MQIMISFISIFASPNMYLCNISFTIYVAFYIVILSFCNKMRKQNKRLSENPEDYIWIEGLCVILIIYLLYLTLWILQCGADTIFHRLSNPAPSKKGLAPAPWSRFYKFLLLAPAPALIPSKKARLSAPWLLIPAPGSRYEEDFNRLQLRHPIIFLPALSPAPCKKSGLPAVVAPQHWNFTLKIICSCFVKSYHRFILDLTYGGSAGAARGSRMTPLHKFCPALVSLARQWFQLLYLITGCLQM